MAGAAGRLPVAGPILVLDVRPGGIMAGCRASISPSASAFEPLSRALPLSPRGNLNQRLNLRLECGHKPKNMLTMVIPKKYDQKCLDFGELFTLLLISSLRAQKIHLRFQ